MHNVETGSRKGMDKYLDLLITGLLSLGTMGLVWLAYVSLDWRFMHDSALMLYAGMMMDLFNKVPYVDTYEMNFPGTLFFYYLVGKLTNYTDLGFRIVDLSLLAAISLCTWGWLRKIDWRAAWGAVIMFGFFYFRLGPLNSLQRDFVLILPVSLSLLLTVSLPRINNYLRLILVGVLAGAAFLIKPHAVLIYVVLGLYQLSKFKEEQAGFGFAKTVLIYAAGFAVPLSVALIYLVRQDALVPFLDIFRNYVPLYSNINGNLTTTYGADRYLYLFTEYFKFGSRWGGFSLSWWLVSASLGVIVVWRETGLTTERKRLIILLAVLVLLGSLYPALSGQFFLYHYFLYMYFVICLGALCLKKSINLPLATKVVLIVALCAVNFWGSIKPLPSILNYAATPLNGGMVDEMALVFKNNLEPGDTVQPLDWTFGVIHAMTLARVPIATSFTCDFQFYHDVDKPYIQALRKRFISELEEKKPKLIVAVIDELKPTVQGPGTNREFAELADLINREYEVVRNDGVLTFYLRKN